jgi:hypothetical protein
MCSIGSRRSIAENHRLEACAIFQCHSLFGGTGILPVSSISHRSDLASPLKSPKTPLIFPTSGHLANISLHPQDLSLEVANSDPCKLPLISLA